MEESSSGKHGSSRCNEKFNSSRMIITKSRYSTDEDCGDSVIECSGNSCKSCTAGIIADCVAVCCCPCAVINFLALAFVKVPWMVGRKCLGLASGKGKKGKRRCKKHEALVDRGNYLEKWRVEEGIVEITSGFEGLEEGNEKISAGYEAEKVWLELYQVGHLGFGRVSFTGIPSVSKGN